MERKSIGMMGVVLVGRIRATAMTAAKNTNAGADNADDDDIVRIVMSGECVEMRRHHHHHHRMCGDGNSQVYTS